MFTWRNLILAGISVCLLLTQAGCAFGLAGLVLNGTRQKVFIDSMPSGAKVTIDGQAARTPAQFDLKRRRDYQAIVEKEGYETTTVYINKDTDALVLYLDGFLLPHLFGTAWDLEPERTIVNLAPKKQ